MTHGMRSDTQTPHLDGGGRNWRDTATRYALLPLRVFLGVTFIYAGIDNSPTAPSSPPPAPARSAT